MARDATILLLLGAALASCAPPCPDARCSSRPLSGGRVTTVPSDPEPDPGIKGGFGGGGGGGSTQAVVHTPPTEFSEWVPGRRGDDDRWVRVGAFGRDGVEVSVDLRSSEWRVTNTGDRAANYACEVNYTCPSGEPSTEQGAAVVEAGSAGVVSLIGWCGDGGDPNSIWVRCKVGDPPD